jgi:hypothetical protein
LDTVAPRDERPPRKPRRVVRVRLFLVALIDRLYNFLLQQG